MVILEYNSNLIISSEYLQLYKNNQNSTQKCFSHRYEAQV